MMGTKISRAALVGKAGEAIVAAELMRRGVSVAYPAYDGGIDLLACREDEPRQVVPIQVKSRSGSCYNFQRDWFKIPSIVLVQVWHAITVPACYVFSNLEQVEEALGQHALSPSWIDNGGYLSNKPGKTDMALVQHHRAKWRRIIDQLPKGSILHSS